jgi:iodotyrosine deiodinase
MSPAEQLRASREFVERMAARRSVRFMSSEPVPFELIENGIRCAALVKDPEIKRKVREAAEAEERESYEHRMPQTWLDALAPLGSDWHKEFLEAEPYLIVVFRSEFGLNHAAECETKTNYYYVQESVGIATAFLLALLHMSGLATLTHTPSPMGFLSSILGRPKNE